MSADTKSSPPFFSPDSSLKTTWGALGTILAIAVGGTVAYTMLRSDVQQHSRELEMHARRFEIIDTKLDVQRQLLLEIRADQRSATRDRENDRSNPR